MCIRDRRRVHGYQRKKVSREQYYENLKKKQIEIVDTNTKAIIDEKAFVVGSVKSILEAKEKMLKETKFTREQQRVTDKNKFSSMAETNSKYCEQNKVQLMEKYKFLSLIHI
eukprot:TRINITY_DN38139_c0_g2_i1.p1 TRINITY_DN38139_c0_g2~~TRINITY_DN38139_c0_g2_i1.p1  ORF type:complete len:112 (+),score=33.61 TRINITY_DN38139_c0_g2_i1:114-449(+)